MLIDVKSLIMMSKGEQSVMGDIAWSVDSIAGDSLQWNNKRLLSKMLNLDILWCSVSVSHKSCFSIKEVITDHEVHNYYSHFEFSEPNELLDVAEHFWCKKVPDSRGMLHYGINHCKIGRYLDNYVTDCSNRITRVIVVLEYIEPFLRRANLSGRLSPHIPVCPML